ncbi:MAG TPA: DUF3048 domain-containing protein [Acidimicrobiales bacterium]|nr:DUF3048 domain-containing protein [Acidimicrobiales bacterium]
MSRRLLPIVFVLSAFAALCAVAPFAAAQDLATQKEQLERRAADLDAKIGTEERNIADADALIAQRQVELNKANVQLELLADEYARAVDSRREPARTRVLIAIDAYVRGDPRITSLLADIVRMETRSEELTQRTLYSAVVEDAEHRLAIVDTHLRELAKKSEAQQAATKSVRDLYDAALEKKRVATESRQKLAAERYDVARQIEDILSRANRAVLTGTDGFENPNRAALVVKIDNVDAARPQVGINQADVVFEEQVEGNLTRLAAVFHSRGSDPIGPVRSMRTTDVHLLVMLDRPLFASSGGNPGTRAQLDESPLVDVGQSAFPDAYYRESRTPPHNLFTSTSELWGSAEGQGGRPKALFSFRAPNAPRPATAVGTGGVDIDFGAARIAYQWNGSGWARTQNGRAHVDGKGVQVTPTNVIVQFTRYGVSAADENSPEAIVTGEGEAWVFTNGYMIRGTWSRKSDASVTAFTDDDGKPIQLTPGTTWIELPRQGSSSLR